MAFRTTSKQYILEKFEQDFQMVKQSHSKIYKDLLAFLFFPEEYE
jgi:hypothetical protein